MAVSQGIEIISANWPAPAHVHACVTTRAGGCSQKGYSDFNLAAHVGDDPQHVESNRAALVAHLKLPGEPRWLSQVHGCDLINAEEVANAPEADAAVATSAGTVCTVLTADCLPVLFTDTAGRRVAAVHAGWRGLCGGILEKAVNNFIEAGIAPDDILVWLGPAIGPSAYEIDEPVRDVFAARTPDSFAAFQDSRPGHWYLNLYEVARIYLADLGVERVFGGEFCTYSDPRFFSFRREIPCGRQASLIWIGD